MSKAVANAEGRSVLKRLANDRRGSVGVIFALAMLPLLGLTGAALDYSRASSVRARMAQAADAAAIAAAKSPELNLADREKLAQSVFKANMADTQVKGLSIKLLTTAGGVRVEAYADVASELMNIVGIDKQRVDVFSEVGTAGFGDTEIALVLDNTGSMANDMAGLRKASTNFINKVFSASGSGDHLKVGIVPYVAVVNPGRAALGMSYVDVTAASKFHGDVLENKAVAMMTNCDPKWGGGGGGGGKDDKGSGGDGAWLQDTLQKLAHVGLELFGVKPAAALGETPNTKAPLTGKMVSPQAGTSALVPDGFSTPWNPCQLIGPNRVNHLDLYDRIPGAVWKGCVEARPEPYDISDDPPNPGNPDTLFVPYFWPDEPGEKGGESDYVNNYMNDNPVPTGWNPLSRWNWESLWTILKYNGLNTAELTETKGPNRACPDEVMRLTSNKTDLLKKVDQLKSWPGSGTISSEGLAWGWRVLSPKAPYADGKSYDKAKKFLVLMSDGENMVGENVKDGPVTSVYSAYGYLSEGRFGKVNFNTARNYLDERFDSACEKIKATGITLMTIYFRDNNSSAKNRMKKCATSGQFYYEAVDTAALDKAFQDIASQISKLRITK